MGRAHLVSGKRVIVAAAVGAGLGRAGWLITLVFHGALATVLGTVYWLAAEVEAPPIVLHDNSWRPTPHDQPVPTETIDLALEQLPDIDAPLELTVSTTAPSGESSTIEPAQRKEGSASPHGDPLPEDASAEVESAAGAFCATIGSAGGEAGLIGDGTQGTGINLGRHDFAHCFAKRYCRGPICLAKQTGIQLGLRWLVRHQSPDGTWSAKRFAANCSDDPKCEPGDPSVGGDVDIALTGYAVLCFLGDGCDQRIPGRYRETVRKGLAALLKAQQASGLLGERTYEHAVAAKALIEAYGMTGDPTLKSPAQRAVDVLLQRQNAGGGWDYVLPSERNDASVTGWCVMALTSAKESGLDVRHGLDAARTWLATAWHAANPLWAGLDARRDESRFAYTWDSGSGQVDIADRPAAGAPASDAHDLACVGLMSAAFLGARSGDPMLETLATYADRHELPASYPCNTYKLYYDSLGIFQVGGETWQRWDDRVTTMLSRAQRRDGCCDGSWDPQGTRFHGHQAGRVLSTVYCCLSLEACLLYARTTGRR